MVNVWKFTMKNISKMPNLYKNFKTKYILLANGSYPCNTKTQAIRYIKNTIEYKNRVSKPKIIINFI